MNYINKINYKKFEEYCCILHQKEYNQITYHWLKIPDKILIDSGLVLDETEIRKKRMKNKNNDDNINIIREYGLDGISIEMIDNEIIYHGLQMKLWDENSILDSTHLGTFYDIFINILSSPKSKGYLYHTCKLGKTMEKNNKKGNRIFPIYLKNPYLQIEKEDNNLKLRYYQIDAIEELKKEWFGNKLLILPCGTGKTAVSSYYCKTQNFSNIFILSPTIILTEQNMNRFSEVLPDYNNLTIDTYGCRDINIIKKNINNKCIFSSTYDSMEDILYNLIKSENINFNNSILIIDEAHNLLNRKKIIEIINYFYKTLLITATPPVEIKKIIDCDIIYEYKFNKAIKDKYICDYNIFLPYIENNEIIIDKPIELIDLDDCLCKKGLFLLNGMLEKGSRNCIVYLKNKEECKLYKDILINIMNKYHYYNVWIEEITAHTNKKKRIKILNEFEKEEDKEIIKIILSIRILDEGIDIPKCDSIFITHIGDINNDIRNIQRICRATRIDNNNINKKANVFLWCDDIDKGLKTLKLFKENDVEFTKKIRINYSNYSKNENSKNIDNEVLNKNDELINIINVKCLTEDEIFENKKNILFEKCNTLNRIIQNSDIKKNKKIRLIYNWYKDIKKNINDFNNLNYIKLSENYFIKNDLDNKINACSVKKIYIHHQRYICYRCNYETDRKSSFINHINKKKICERSIESYKYNEDEISNKINEQLLKYENDYECKNCKIVFSNKQNLNRHNKTFHNSIDTKKDNAISNSYNVSNSNNTLNSNNTNTNINNIEININVSPIPFDEDWDLSMISIASQHNFIFSQMMYSKLLEEILNNKLNLNVIIDDENSGIVYKNDKYTKMKFNDIIDKSMEKLNKNLLDIHNDIEDNFKNFYNKKFLDESKEIINEKLKNFNIKSDVQKHVRYHLSKIFNDKKEDAINIMKNIVKEDDGY